MGVVVGFVPPPHADTHIWVAVSRLFMVEVHTLLGRDPSAAPAEHQGGGHFSPHSDQGPWG